MFFLFFFFISPLVHSRLELLHIQGIWRHGERAPAFGSIHEDEHVFRAGMGKLTDAGESDSVKIGKFIRNEYIVKHKVLPETYKEDTMHFRSVNVQRCIRTAQLVFKGMYGDCKKEIPIEYPPKGTIDYMLGTGWFMCPAFTKAFQQSCPSFPETDTIKKFTDFEKIAFGCSNASELTTKYSTFDNYLNAETDLAREHAGGYLDKNHTRNEADQALNISVYVWAYETGVGQFHNPELNKGYAGYLFDTIVKNMKNAWECMKGDRLDNCTNVKFHGISTQDYIMNVLLEIMGTNTRYFALSPYTYVRYNCLLLAELWVDGDKPKVRLLYRSDPESKAKSITHLVNRCNGEEFCDLDEFSGCCEARTEEPWKECQKK